jgi:hypothetical protein
VSLNVTVPAEFGTNVHVSETRTDETHGDAYTIWVSQGSPAAPAAAQLTALRQGMEPVVVQPEHAVDVTNGVVNVAFELPRFGISLVTIAPASGGTGGAGGEAGTSGTAGAPAAVASEDAGCGCSIPGAPGTTGRVGAGLVLALLASYRRRWLGFRARRALRVPRQARQATSCGTPVPSGTVAHQPRMAKYPWHDACNRPAHVPDLARPSSGFCPARLGGRLRR